MTKPTTITQAEFDALPKFTGDYCPAGQTNAPAKVDPESTGTGWQTRINAVLREAVGM